MNSYRFKTKLDSLLKAIRDFDSLSIDWREKNIPLWIRRLFILFSPIGSGVFWGIVVLVAGTSIVADPVSSFFSQKILMASIAPGMAWLMVSPMKKWVRRARPFQVNPSLDAHKLFSLDESFPSGHTASMTAFAFAALGQNVTWAWSSVGLAFIVGVSRYILGVHYPSDVIAGAGIGILSGFVHIVFFNGTPL